MAAPGSVKAVVAPAPPQPVEQKVTVKRGGSVDIPLRIYGTRAQTLAWIIRDAPRHGKLSPVRATASETAVVTYRPPADVRIAADRFTFSVRSAEGVSAAVEVTIAITDEAPQISAPVELDFGALLLGATSVKTMDFTNSGGGIAEGTFEVSPPWRIEGARTYKLPAGDRRAAKIVFAPERAGNFESELRFTSQPDRVINLRGIAEAALAMEPAALVLSRDAGQPLRAAAFTLKNNTDQPLDVALTASARLVLKKSLHLEPHAAAPVAVQAAETDATAVRETIVCTAGTLTAKVRVTADPLPALIRAQPDIIAFRKASIVEHLALQNFGGMESKVTLSIEPPFSVKDASFTLPAGAAKEVEIALATRPAGTIQTALKVSFDGQQFEIPVEAHGAIAEPTAASPRRASAPIKIKREPEPSEPSEPVASEDFTLPAIIDATTGNSATLHWKNEAPAGTTLRCLERALSLDAEGELVVTFQDYLACKFTPRDGQIFATIEKLEPGKMYYFRIDAAVADGASPVAFAEFFTPAPPARKSPISLSLALFIAAIVTGGLSIWRRTRSSSGF